MSLVFEIQQSAQSMRCVPPSGLNLLDQSRRLSMILSTRSASERLATGGVGRCDSRKYSQCGRRAGILHVRDWFANELCYLEKLARVLEAYARIGRRAGFGAAYRRAVSRRGSE